MVVYELGTIKAVTSKILFLKQYLIKNILTYNTQCSKLSEDSKEYKEE